MGLMNRSDLENDTYTFFGPIDIAIYGDENNYDESFTFKITVSVVLCIFMVLSIIGNVCTLAVIARDKSMRTPTNCYLCNLAITDLMMAFYVPTEVYFFWVPDFYPFGEVGCRIHFILWDCVSNCSVLTIVAFTVERYLVVSRPFLRQRLTIKSRVYKIIAVIWIVCCVLCIPDIFYIDLLERKKYVYCYYTVSDLMRIFIVVDIFVFFVVPMSIILVLYVLIALKLKATQRKLRCSPVYGKQERDKAVKMLAVAGLFFVGWAPYCGYRIMVITPKYKYDDYYNVSMAWRVLYYMCAINVYLSTAGNPILYSLMSRRFRTAFKDFLKGRNSSLHRGQTQTSLHSTMNSTYYNRTNTTVGNKN
ncbi:pyrokinin-1 receptor-like isoform X2 [Pectinophora gossypiella]|uniref:pyrokinin-1 receptor-like isoform X2 n=1 Tax=Pectinophora gossypiella TaxID=13191 RepID=UPI00214EC5CC|nr:pyrokinin-1 receptor-like isoform X2 [Pectinophora gossypiella]